MPYVLKCFTAATAAVIALAVSASSALANPVEVLNENSEHCTPVSVVDHVVSGGCEFHTVGTAQMIRHTPMGEVVVQSCANEQTLNVDEFGEGWVSGISFPPGDVSCNITVRPCVEDSTEHVGPQEPWRVHVEETGPETLHAIVRGCLRVQVSSNPDAFCELEGDAETDLNFDGSNYSAESSGGAPDPDSGIFEEQSQAVNRVVVAHEPGVFPHFGCEALAAQLEFAGHGNSEGPLPFSVVHPLG
jgi:hypothetical protein